MPGWPNRLGTAEEYLWPDVTLEEEQEVEEEVDEATSSELAGVYPHRASVPAELWRRLLHRATERIAILVHAGQFLYEQQPQIVDILRTKAAAGTDVRILLAEEVGHTHERYRPLDDHRGITIRLHRTPLYCSTYRFDEEMLVHNHLYGISAAHGPVMHLHRVPHGDLFAMYLRSFEHVWQDAVPAWAPDTTLAI